MRFIGLFAEEGIGSLAISNATQVDHLQYGFSIPEASSSLMLALSLLGLGGVRHRGD